MVNLALINRSRFKHTYEKNRTKIDFLSPGTYIVYYCLVAVEFPVYLKRHELIRMTLLDKINVVLRCDKQKNVVVYVKVCWKEFQSRF
jgi:hypothetical protein